MADGVRAVGIEARKVSTRDIMLAMRLNAGDIDVDLPLSASIRADVAADGTPQLVQGQLIADAGTIVDRDNDKVSLNIDRADFRFNWDARRRSLVVPFQVQSGGNQFTMRATLEGSPEQNGTWLLGVARGNSVIDPIIIAPGATADDEGIAINRVAVRARIDTNRKRIELQQGDLSRIDTRPSHNIGIAVTGSFDYSGAEPHIAFGVAGTRMPMSALKRLWPFFAAVAVRSWVEEHISGGMVERVVVAGNAPLEDFKHNGPPVPEDGLSGRHRDERDDVASDLEFAADPRRRSHGSCHRPKRDSSISVAAPSKRRPGESSTLRVAFSRCRIPIPSQRRRGRVSVSMAVCRPPPRCLQATDYVTKSASPSIRPQLAARFRPRSRSNWLIAQPMPEDASSYLTSVRISRILPPTRCCSARK